VPTSLLGPGNTDDFYTSKYLDLPLGPQFEFGYGLSYTRFELGTPRIDHRTLSVADLAAGKRVEVSVPVRNVGDRFGDNVVQRASIRCRAGRLHVHPHRRPGGAAPSIPAELTVRVSDLPAMRSAEG
jgi:hypothetical protein